MYMPCIVRHIQLRASHNEYKYRSVSDQDLTIGWSKLVGELQESLRPGCVRAGNIDYKATIHDDYNAIIDYNAIKHCIRLSNDKLDMEKVDRNFTFWKKWK